MFEPPASDSASFSRGASTAVEASGASVLASGAGPAEQPWLAIAHQTSDARGIQPIEFAITYRRVGPVPASSPQSRAKQWCLHVDHA